MSLPLPAFYSADRAGTLYPERVGEVAAAAASSGLSASGQKRVALLGIDPQVAFCHPDASLFVPGAVEDTERAARFILEHAENIDGIFVSLDTHAAHQIFHAAWWEDSDGNAPSPMTVIRASDVESGRWIPRRMKAHSLDYCKQLEAGGRYVLTIWPYHALEGSVMHPVMPILREALLFHELATGNATHFVAKGQDARTENYSVFSPEVQALKGIELGEFNRDLADALLEYDKIFVFGQASSHCVLSSLRDLQGYVECFDRTELSKIHILTDTMSPVPAPPIDPLPPELDFPTLADQAFQRFEAAGMKVLTTAEAEELF